VSRTQFGLSEHETLYLCPQTLFKVHPDFDAMLAGILRRDPRGRVVLIRNHCTLWWRQLSARFARTIPDVCRRISCIQQVGQTEFVRLLACADVVLDTIHFNGMNTSLEAFSVATPVVTLPGALQRGRHTRAMYEKMAIDSYIARDEQHYIDIAVGLGTNAALRADASQSIRERSHILFEDAFVVAEFERFFATAVANLT
jgi:predicted O-linked N-acetylglucosamine transferase (SPINDLY family)